MLTRFSPVPLEQPSGTSGGSGANVCLIDGPYVTRGSSRVDIPEASQRVVAYVALHSGPVDRRIVAVRLWPDSPESRASGNLRTALWRLRSTEHSLLTTDRHRLMLSADTAVDVSAVRHWATRVIDGTAAEHDLDLRHLDACLGELLPGWYEDWVIFERERLRQRVLHALEVLTERLTASHRGPDAVEAGSCAVRLDPLRESAQRALIKAHLASGNLVEARQAHDRYSQLLRDELDVTPPAALTDLVVGLAPGRRAGANVPSAPGRAGRSAGC